MRDDALDETLREVDAFAVGNIQTTELGFAEAFARENRGTMKYVPERAAWVSLDPVNNHWVEDISRPVQQIKRLFRAADARAAYMPDAEKNAYRRGLRALESNQRIRGIHALAAREPGMSKPLSEFDRNVDILPVANGVIELRTGECRPCRPDDYVTVASPVAYDPAAQCPLWLKFIFWAMSDNPELVRFVQRLFGASLSGRILEHFFIQAVGSGLNGKSVLLRVLAALMGRLHQRLPAQSLMLGSANVARNDIAKLRGARVVTASEIQEGSRLDEALIKDLTGGDIVTARYLHREYFDFLPTCTLWVATNHLPVIRGSDPGIWRRCLVLPFDRTVPEDERDPELPEKLMQELPGILNWALEGCREWYAHGLQPPAPVLAAVAAYKSSMDLVAQFLEERCVTGSGNACGGRELYAAYREWATESGFKPVAVQRFADDLRRRGIERVRTKSGTEYHGVRVLSRWEADQ